MPVELGSVSLWISRNYLPALSEIIILLDRETEALAPLYEVRDLAHPILCC